MDQWNLLWWRIMKPFLGAERYEVGFLFNQCVLWPPAERWFLARRIFDPEDGGDTFLRNAG
jgi:hypothetical protein